MKTKEDHYTSEMFGNRPGRPRKPNAATVAQRVAKHRAKKKATLDFVTSNEKETQVIPCNLCGGFPGQCTSVCRIGRQG